jgi:hypothetical protein
MLQVNLEVGKACVLQALACVQTSAACCTHACADGSALDLRVGKKLKIEGMFSRKHSYEQYINK